MARLNFNPKAVVSGASESEPKSLSWAELGLLLGFVYLRMIADIMTELEVLPLQIKVRVIVIMITVCTFALMICFVMVSSL